MGCRALTDAVFCRQLHKFLQGHLGKSIKEIRDLDLSRWVKFVWILIMAAKRVVDAVSVGAVRAARRSNWKRIATRRTSSGNMFYLAQLVEKRRTLYSLIRAEALAHLILGPQIEFTEWTADGHLRTWRVLPG